MGQLASPAEVLPIATTIYRAGGERASEGAAVLHLGAFGKHPGWDDHMDDLGLETERLVQVKRSLYVDGFQACIDSGAWEKLTPGNALEQFRHVFLWRARGGLVAGRFWSSRDGRGRTKYPMVVCVQCQGVGVDWIVANVYPELARLEQACTLTTSSDEVRRAVDECRRSLRERAAAGAGPELRIDPAGIAALAVSESLGPERRGLMRVMYQIEREMEAFTIAAPGATLSTRSRMVAPRAQHIRLPRTEAAPAESLARWLRFMLTMLDPAASILLIAPEQEAWVDVIVGDPSTVQLQCIKAAPGAIPLATDIPYSLDDAFLRAAAERLEQASKGPARTLEPLADRGVRSTMERAKESAPSGGGRRVLLGVGIGLAVIVLIAVGVLVFGGGDGGEPAAPPQPAPLPPVAQPQAAAKPVPSDAQDAATPSEEVPAGWIALCDAYGAWFDAFASGLNEPAPPVAARAGKRRWEWWRDADPDLARLVNPVVDSRAGSREEGAFDPWGLSGARVLQSLSSLKDSPPESVTSPDSRASIDAAAAMVEEVRQGLVDWRVRMDLASVAAVLRERGLKDAADEATALAEGIVPGRSGVSLVQAVDKALVLSPKIQPLARVLESARALRGASEGPGAAGPRVFLELVASGVQGATEEAATLASVASALAPLESLGADLVKFVRENAGALDLADYAASEEHARLVASGASPEAVKAWMFQAGRFRRLAADADPRRTWAAEIDAQLDSAESTLAKFRAEPLKTEPDAALVERAMALRRQREAVAALPWNERSRDEVVSSVRETGEAAADLANDASLRLRRDMAALLGKAEDVRASIEAMSSVGASEAVNAVWRAWRKRLLEGFSEDSFAEIGAKAEALAEALKEFEAEVPPPQAGTWRGRPWSRSLVAAAGVEYDRLVGGSLGPLAVRIPERPRDAMRAPIEAVRIPAELLSNRLAEFAADAEAMEGLLIGCHSPDEVRGGVSIRSLAGKWEDDPFFAGAEPLRANVDRVLTITSGLPRLELIAIVEQAGTGGAPPEVGLQAWRSLAAPGAASWPSTVEELEAESRLSEGLNTMVRSSNLGAREAVLLKEIADGRSGRWNAVAASPPDPAAMDRILDLAGKMGAKLDSAPPRVRYNTAVHTLMGALVAAGPDEGAANSAVDSFRAAVEPTVRDVPRAAEVLAEIASVRAADAPAKPVFDPGRAGPGSVGWSVQSERGGAALTYTSPDRAASVRFIRLGSGDDTAYLADSELTISQAAAILRTAKAGGGAEPLKALAELSADVRGVLAWRVVSGLEPAAAWMKSSEMVIADSVPPRPGDSTPLQQVSVGFCSCIADLAGCRLPLLAEWLAAFAAMGNPGPSPSENFRDRSFKRQQEHLAALRVKHSTAPLADVESIVARTSRRGGAEVATADWDDGTVFFRPAQPSSADRFQHLVGNVAEFVLRQPVVPAGKSKDEWLQWSTTNRTSVCIVGGSAFSDLAASPVEPVELPVRQAGASFADVGLRLAFGMGGASAEPPALSRRLLEALSPAPYLLRE